MLSDYIRWTILILIVVAGFGLKLNPVLTLGLYVLPTVFIFMHGKRYLGTKNIVLFFIIICLVSYITEYLGVHTGKIFGTYYYNIVGNGPLLGGVPPLLMLTYFSIAYSSYMVLRVLLGFFGMIRGWFIIWYSVLGGLLMTLTDLASDPVNSTINKVYIWSNGGGFFGVPYLNFIGWFGETFVFFMLISVIFAYITHAPKSNKPLTKSFTFEPIVLFAAPVIPIIIRPLYEQSWPSIYQSMSLIALFALGFIIVLACARNFISKA